MLDNPAAVASANYENSDASLGNARVAVGALELGQFPGDEVSGVGQTAEVAVEHVNEYTDQLEGGLAVQPTGDGQTRADTEMDGSQFFVA